MEPGELDAITDVGGVRVGHTTLIHGDGPLRPGEGPVRTGVTVVIPHDGDVWTEPVFAGGHRLNGNGELTGLEWIREAGMLAGAIGITNTHSVGVVRDALIEAAARAHAMSDGVWALPTVGETYDGALNDINGFHVRPEHVHAALAAATNGPVAEGNVGGGTGMICHEFKGGIGTASRRAGEWTVGVLVQANYGERDLLRIDGVPVGASIPTSDVPSPWDQADAVSARASAEGGSIIGIVATDAPLLPHQCARLAQRVGMGVARMGSYASHGSGDLFCAFATGNRDLSRNAGEDDPRRTLGVRDGGRPAHQPAARGGRRGHRGSDRQCSPGRRDDGRPRWDHRARDRHRRAHGGHARPRALGATVGRAAILCPAWRRGK